MRGASKEVAAMTGLAVRHRSPWVLWPFAVIWDLLTFFLIALGRVLTGLTGFLLMAVGVLITLTVVGAPLGIPLAALGLLLMVRSAF
jgi:hypothetical protein